MAASAEPPSSRRHSVPRASQAPAHTHARLAKKRGLGAEQAKELARSINLGAWASCAEGGLRDWYLSVGPLVYPSTLLTSSGMASKLGLLAPVVGDDTWRSDWDAFDTAQL